jgi:xylose isomerase
MKLIEDGRIDKFIEDRYSSYTRGIGKEIVDGNVTLEQLSDYAMGLENVEVESGRQEYLEAIVNNVIFSK